jgi:hypothetical protein
MRVAAGLTLLIVAATTPADARGGHGHGGFGGHGMGRHTMHGEGEAAGALAGGRRHGNDAYTKAASDEEDRLLNTRLKSICRGC